MHHVPYNPEISDLRERALSVMRPDVVASTMSARTAARCLSGVVGLAARRYSVSAMQRACGDLARFDAAWSHSQLPAGPDGRVSELVEMIAVVARGILPLCGVDAMRAALAFWASESDPAVWTSVVAG